METTTITAVLFRSFSNSDRFLDRVEVDRSRVLNFMFETWNSETWHVLNFIFESTNAPTDFLTSEQMWIRKIFADAGLYSVSVGDVIQLDERYYMCRNSGWEEIPNFQETYNLD